MSSTLIKSVLAAAIVAAMTGGAMAYTSDPVDSAGNPVSPSGNSVENSVGSQLNPVEENQREIYNRVGEPLPGVMNESNRIASDPPPRDAPIDIDPNSNAHPSADEPQSSVLEARR